MEENWATAETKSTAPADWEKNQGRGDQLGVALIGCGQTVNPPVPFHLPFLNLFMRRFRCWQSASKSAHWLGGKPNAYIRTSCSMLTGWRMSSSLAYRWMGQPKLRSARLVEGWGVSKGKKEKKKTAKENTPKVQISVYSVNVSWWGGRSVTRGLCKRMGAATGESKGE